MIQINETAAIDFANTPYGVIAYVKTVRSYELTLSSVAKIEAINSEQMQAARRLGVDCTPVYPDPMGVKRINTDSDYRSQAIAWLHSEYEVVPATNNILTGQPPMCVRYVTTDEDGNEEWRDAPLLEICHPYALEQFRFEWRSPGSSSQRWGELPASLKSGIPANIIASVDAMMVVYDRNFANAKAAQDEADRLILQGGTK